MVVELIAWRRWRGHFGVLRNVRILGSALGSSGVVGSGGGRVNSLVSVKLSFLGPQKRPDLEVGPQVLNACLLRVALY